LYYFITISHRFVRFSKIGKIKRLKLVPDKTLVANFILDLNQFMAFIPFFIPFFTPFFTPFFILRRQCVQFNVIFD